MQNESLNEVRRYNARLLLKAYCGNKIKTFAEKIGKDSSFVSQRIGPNPFRNIARNKGSNTAGLIEQAFDKAEGWLDKPASSHEEMDMLGYDSSREKCLPYSEVPLFQPEDIAQLSKRKMDSIEAEKRIICPVRLPIGGFAVHMPDSSMESDKYSNLSIPSQSIVFVEPVKHGQISNKDTVLALFESGEYVLRMYIKDLEDIILAPLNHHYRTRELKNGFIVGKVKSVLIEY